MKINGLILAGGKSERMGTDKGSLPWRGQNLLTHAFEVLSSVLSEASVYISIRRDQSLQPPSIINSKWIYDEYENIGPASGLLAAHSRIPDSHWLVVACDFPLMTELACRELLFHHERVHQIDVTCFVNPEGIPEPLFAVWSPQALSVLSRHSRNPRRNGPISTLLQLPNQLIQPTDSNWICNTNTPEEWKRIQSFE
jgi:molybdopterin-guanine dinucleotide biosynthesis protein A